MHFFPILFLLAVSSTLLKSAESYFPPSDSEGGWRSAQSAQEVRDLDGMNLDKLVPAYEIRQRSSGNGGLLVVHNSYLC